MEPKFQKFGLYGDWEKESLRIWAYLSQSATVILDIGANTGVFSILSSVNNPKARIIAVEPIDVNFSILQQNINKNKITNIAAIKVAISNTDGIAKMFMLKDSLNYMTSINLNRYDDAPEVKQKREVVEVEIPMISFPTLQHKYNLDKLDLVKIDVEEHEYEVLQSMYPLIQKTLPNILVEIIGVERAKDIDALLAPLEYKIIAIYETQPSKIVTNVWDNSHHNFLFCNQETFEKIKVFIDFE